MEVKSILLLIIVFSSLSLLDCNNESKGKISTESYGFNDTIINNKKRKNKIKVDKFPRRKLPIDDGGVWEQLNILLDLTNFDLTYSEFPAEYASKKNIFIEAMNKAKTTLESFIKIFNAQERPEIPDSYKNEWQLSGWDTRYFGTEGTNSKNFDFGYNYGIFFKIAELEPDCVATSKILLNDGKKQPLIGLITINKLISIDKIELGYLEALMLHHFTHLLGFKLDKDDYDEEFIGIIKNQGTSYYVESPKVIDYAKKYFGCQETGNANEITRIELEIDHYNNPHWPSRILLGEYMTKFNYMEEQVISGFTLAFLEDLGYIKVDGYYTGGLMRFGKHKGCDFVKKKCVGEGKVFKNEFYYPENEPTDGSNSEESCSSGRLSRTLYKLKEYGSNIVNYQYYSNPKLGGFYPIADYCPIAVFSPSETSLFSGRCSSTKGKIKNSSLTQKIGESLSDRSFCALSSMVKSQVPDALTNDVRAVCFEMYCSDQSLTIKFGRDYFVCPREGGKIEGFEGFQGFLLCPDYNLICTAEGSALCNDMIDCVNKKIKEKEASFNYEYTIGTSQVSSEYLLPDNALKAGELSNTNNKCPQFCSHCGENKICKKCAPNFVIKNNICVSKVPHCFKYDVNEKCITCEENYVFVDGNDSECKSKTELGRKYIPDSEGSKNYVRCSTKITNCDECDSAINCISCFDNYGIVDDIHTACVDISNNNYYYNANEETYKLCSHGLTNCEKCNTIENIFNCLQCASGYSLVHKDTNVCSPTTDIENDNSIFTDDNKLNYYLCSDNKYHLVENCLKCHNKDTCDSCINDYFLFNSNKLCLSQRDIKDRYYKNPNDNNYYPCSSAIKGCEKCNNAATCIECNIAYDLDENNKCIPSSLINIRYYLDASTGRYVSCAKIENCEECTSATECTRCKSGYELGKGNKCKLSNNNKTRALATCAIVLSTIAIVGSIVAIVLIFFKNVLFGKSATKNGESSVNQKIEENIEDGDNIVFKNQNKRSIRNVSSSKDEN